MNYSSLEDKINKFASLSSKKTEVYGPYTNSRDREFVILVDKDGNRKTKSYPKYLLEQHLGRELDPNEETVDHVNYNRKDNDISNLEIIPRKEHSRLDTRRVKLVKLNCVLCNKEFERSPRDIRDKASKGKSGPYCSKSCAAKYGRALALKKIDKLPAQTPIKSEYYRLKIEQKKNKKADLTELFIKLAGLDIE